MELRASELDFVVRKPVLVWSFGAIVRQSVRKTFRFFVMQFRNACRANPKGKAITLARDVKTASSQRKVKVIRWKIGKTRIRALRAVASSDKQGVRLNTFSEKKKWVQIQRLVCFHCEGSIITPSDRMQL
jgi:hypothetical protein